MCIRVITDAGILCLKVSTKNKIYYRKQKNAVKGGLEDEKQNDTTNDTLCKLLNRKQFFYSIFPIVILKTL